MYPDVGEQRGDARSLLTLAYAVAFILYGGVLLTVAAAAIRLLFVRKENVARDNKLSTADEVARESVVDRAPARRISRDEVAKHNTKSDCWIVIHNLVLDVTHYIPVHPGGSSFLVDNAGGDASKGFDMVHSIGDIELYAPEVVIGVTTD